MDRQDVDAVAHGRGFTLVEVVVVLAIVALLSVIAFPGYRDYIARARSHDAIADVVTLSNKLEIYCLTHNGELPDSLSQLDGLIPRDPWDRPYEYLRIEGGNIKGKGGLRKDKNLNPLNSDFDLYSRGPDGASVGPLTASPSRDDIVRAQNGLFVGIAEDY